MSRYTKIEQYIEKKINVSTKELIEKFDLSAPTIHRFFDKLQNEGKIKRIHGGAIAIEEKNETLFDKKLKINLENKKSICEFVAKKFIQDDDVIGIDSGTTAYHLVDYLDKEHLTIITNGLKIASHAAQTLPYANVICSGGTVRSQLSVCVGANATDFFKNIRINRLILTCSGIEPEHNKIYEVDPLIAEVKQVMMSVSTQVILLVTSDRMNTPSLSFLTKISHVHDIVCDSMVDEDTLKLYSSYAAKLHIARIY